MATENDTIDALAAIIASAKLTDEQKVLLRQTLYKKRKPYISRATGPKSRCKVGEWIKVVYTDQTVDRLWVAHASSRMLKLGTSERIGNAGRVGGPKNTEAKLAAIRKAQEARRNGAVMEVK